MPKGKAQADAKAQSRQRRDEQYLLRRLDELLNVHKIRCEIPHTPAGQRRHWVLARLRRVKCIFEIGSN